MNELVKFLRDLLRNPFVQFTIAFFITLLIGYLIHPAIGAVWAFGILFIWILAA